MIVELKYKKSMRYCRRRNTYKNLLLAPLVALVLIHAATTSAGHSVARWHGQPGGVSTAEFSRLIRELSEKGGYFHSDNFISNETSYLHVIDKMLQVGVTSGGYIGVGPEQNFTYIAKTRPRIAFIVDIRRQAMIQHLMYKAIFHLSPDRAHFFSLLLSKTLPKGEPLAPDVSINELLTYFSHAPADDKTYEANLLAINKMIQEDFQFPLTPSEQESLGYIYKNFRNYGLDIAYHNQPFWGLHYPTLKYILAQTDINGKQNNFLASSGDYDFLRNLQLRNLIIPVVGDFSGSKALAAIGGYLREKGITVSAFYTSNVEQYLFDNGLFVSFVNNVRKLPVNNRSYFIRSTSLGYEHPARRPGHRSVTLLQQIKVFIRNAGLGKYQNYNDLVASDYIAAGKPWGTTARLAHIAHVRCGPAWFCAGAPGT